MRGLGGAKACRTEVGTPVGSFSDDGFGGDAEELIEAADAEAAEDELADGDDFERSTAGAEAGVEADEGTHSDGGDEFAGGEIDVDALGFGGDHAIDFLLDGRQIGGDSADEL